MPQPCASFALCFPPFCLHFAIVEAAHAEPAHTHTHSLSLSLSLPFLSPFCSSRATNNRGPLYLLLHHTISDQCALVLTAFSPSYSPNSHVDHSSIVQHLPRPTPLPTFDSSKSLSLPASTIPSYGLHPHLVMHFLSPQHLRLAISFPLSPSPQIAHIRVMRRVVTICMRPIKDQYSQPQTHAICVCQEAAFHTTCIGRIRTAYVA